MKNKIKSIKLSNIIIVLFLAMLIFPFLTNVVEATSTVGYKDVIETMTNSINSFPERKQYNDGTYKGVLGRLGSVQQAIVSPVDSRQESENYTGTTYPASTYSYNKDGYTGILYLDVNSVTSEEKDGNAPVYITRQKENIMTSYYNEYGNHIRTEYSWDNTNDHPYLDINDANYEGRIPKTGGFSDPPGAQIFNPDGSYKVSQRFVGIYEGYVNLKNPAAPYTIYTGVYKGTVTKPPVYEYRQQYKGTAYTEVTIKKNLGNAPNSDHVGDPVNIVTGNFYATDLDLSIKDLGPSLEIMRYYNSLDTRSGMLGKGWRLNYESSIEFDATTGRALVTYPEGKTIIFELKPEGFVAPETVFDKLVRNVNGRFELTLQDNTVYSYNYAGKLSAITDKNGNRLTIDYDNNGDILAVYGESGRSLNFTTVGGRITTITDPAQRTIVFGYQGENLRSVKDTGDGYTYYDYNSWGITSITDQNNKKFVQNIYDDFGRVIKQYDENNNLTIFDYDDVNRINSYTFMSSGNKVSYHYSEKLYITRKTFQDNTYEEYGYDQWGNKRTIRDRNGNVTTYEYNIRGNLLSTTSPAPYNYKTSYQYDAKDNLLEIKGQGGFITNYEYDAKSNLTKTILKLDGTTTAETTYEYDTKGRLVSIKDAENNITIMEYNVGNFNNVTKIIDPMGGVIEYTYDTLSRRITETTIRGTSTFKYNNKDKVEEIIDPLNNITRMKYDYRGNLVKLIRPEQYNSQTADGQGYTFAYDGMDRLIREADPLGNVKAYKYNDEGQKIKDINPNFYNSATGDGIGTAFQYDSSGRVIRITNPSGKKSRIKYDGVGNIVKLIDANNYIEAQDNGPGIEYVYDSLNRLIMTKDHEGRVIKKLVYDPDGRIIKQIDGKGYLAGADDNTRYGVEYKYNLAGWLLEKREPLKVENGTMYYRITKYKYNKVGKVVEEQLSRDYVTLTGTTTNWNTITYTYDKSGRTKTISDTTGSYMEYQYDSLGNVIQEKVKINSTKFSVTGYEYDKLGRIIKTWREIDAADLATGGTGKVLSETLFQYDKNGNLIQIKTPEGYVTSFEYDLAGRLVDKIERVEQYSISIKGAAATIKANRTNIYQGSTVDLTLALQPDEAMKGVNIQVDYDTRLFTVVNSESLSAASVNTNTSGKIIVSAAGVNYTGETNVAKITLRVNETVSGTSAVLINKASTYTSANGTHLFADLKGKTFYANGPDMNEDGKVELNDFTLTALLKDVANDNILYEEKYDIDYSGVIDTTDLDFIKDWIFQDRSSKLNKIALEKLLQHYTGSVYEAGFTEVDRKTSYQYDKAGNLIKETDVNNRSVEYRYDAYNRLISVKDKSGAVSRVFYDEVGNRIKSVLPENYNTAQDDGQGTTYTFDPMNRLVTVTNAQGEVIQKNIYDINGNITKIIDGKGYQSSNNDSSRYGIEYTYDIGNRVITIITPEAKQKNKTTAIYTYDAQNNILTYIDGDSNTTTYVRDAWGRATRITDAENIITNYEYDFAGNLVMSRDGKNNATRYSYNSLNQIDTITDPTNQVITYKYDKEGRLVKEIDRNGKAIVLEYNRDSNVTARKVEGTTDTEFFYYNKDASLLAAANANGIDTFEYTPDGYLQKKSRNGKTLLEYAYNKNGNITAVTTIGKTTNYDYDLLGRLKTVKEGNNLLATYNYNVDGTVSTINYGTGINIAYDYDRDKNISTIQQKNPHGGIINSLSYTYDVRGNQLTKLENNQTTNYTYDKINRLKTAAYPEAKTEVFTYDNAGNRTRKEIGQDITTYEYDTRNRLTKTTNNGIITTYNYDNNGNLMKETKGNEITSYTYDNFNRPIEVVLPNGSYQLNHYDAMGLRVGVTENGVRHEFIFSGRNVVAEVNSNTGGITRYVRGKGLIATEDPRGILSYYLHNAHGDVINLVNGNGEIQNAYKYDAFGNTTDYAAKVSNRFLYAGEQFDKVTGQYYLRARYYDPELGRFTQEDPYRGDGLNLYAYVSNNPIRYVDPTGNFAEDGNGGYYNHITNEIVEPKSNIVKNNSTQTNTSSKCNSSGTNKNGKESLTVEILIHTGNSWKNFYGHADIIIGDNVYSFGRYGDSWAFDGKINLGPFNYEGAGVLFKADDKKEYIDYEIGDKRNVIGYALDVTTSEAKKIEEFYSNLIGDGESLRSSDAFTAELYTFDKDSEYYEYQFWGGPNCATVVVDALIYALGEDRLGTPITKAISPAMLEIGLRRNKDLVVKEPIYYHLK